MDIQKIETQLSSIEQAFAWAVNVPASEQLEYKKKLINIRREFKRIRYAVSEQCSTAAFGESQMGKSYLVSALLSTPSAPFTVTDGQQEYNFINEINPSSPNSTIEATGVITRFSTSSRGELPQGYLRVQLLTVPDIILLLCEAYYNQVDYSHDSVVPSETINECIRNIVPDKPLRPTTLLEEDDILDVLDYIKSTSSLQKKCTHLLGSDLFNYLVLHLRELGEGQLQTLIQLLWNNNQHITRLWNDMLKTYAKLNFQSQIFVRFDAVLKRKGTLLDVARLDEMYGEPEAVMNDYEPQTEVKLSTDGQPIRIEKSFLSSLIAELNFDLDASLENSHPFLHDLDILDFPGARRPEQCKEDKLDEGKNLSTILRRGKVSYLFNKYSTAKRISTLLFCHNNNQSAESTMGQLLDSWVNSSVGRSPADREAYMQLARTAPLFIIGTWFNKDLDYQDEAAGDIDRLAERWKRRFNVVLEKEVLKSLGDDEHWFNNWSSSVKPFQNIFMLRDFKYSKGIYQGYDPETGQSEQGAPVTPTRYPAFFSDLRTSFINDEFVRLHFTQPEKAWDAAATVANDGTHIIIDTLGRIAPNVARARDEKFAKDLSAAVKELRTTLERYYHPESGDEKLKLAKRQAGSVCMQIDRMIGQDPYAFGRLIDTMMISESEIYEFAHEQLLGEEQPLPASSEETQIFMSAGLDSSASREDNIERLCDYLGVDDEDEVRSALAEEGIELDSLLAQSQMQASRAEQFVELVEGLWYDDLLAKRAVAALGDVLPGMSTVVSGMWSLYKMLGMRKRLAETVHDYLSTLDRDSYVGIISDYLSMQLNAFVSSFAFDFMTREQQQALVEKALKLKVNISPNILNANERTSGLQLLTELSKLEEMLSNNDFKQQDRLFLEQFPQYNRVWRWQQYMRLGLLYACDLPDYDIRANAQLKEIIDSTKEL
ncbi:MAG: hypothetical protein J5486_04090 [Bacteroidaceae bacterium]|nr:hypothetical protein [Bacteroidaceae bacterium]